MSPRPVNPMMLLPRPNKAGFRWVARGWRRCRAGRLRRRHEPAAKRATQQGAWLPWCWVACMTARECSQFVWCGCGVRVRVRGQDCDIWGPCKGGTAAGCASPCTASSSAACRPFAHYAGSLTTPPCSEGVDWFVFIQPIKVTDRQVRHGPGRPAALQGPGWPCPRRTGRALLSATLQVLDFMHYAGADRTYATNSRPLQALNRRRCGQTHSRRSGSLPQMLVHAADLPAPAPIARHNSIKFEM